MKYIGILIFFCILYAEESNDGLDILRKHLASKEMNYPSGKKRFEGKYNKEGKRIGLWKEYFENGNIREIVEYTKESDIKSHKIYFSNGNLDLEIISMGNSVGHYLKNYYESGELKAETYYFDKTMKTAMGKTLNRKGDIIEFFQVRGGATYRYSPDGKFLKKEADWVLD